MPTRVQGVQPTTQLCDHCRRKPKFSKYDYCSKTCANEAATLCNHCHAKPKHKNFEYCGKHCAALANTQPRKSGIQSWRATASHGGKGKSVNPQRKQAQLPPNGSIQTLAKLLAQEIPQFAPANPSVVYHTNENHERMRNSLSMRHREEVVTTEPCIMCSIRAQSETDYFCGQACREQALQKPNPTR